jgi:hypothetical protein
VQADQPRKVSAVVPDSSPRIRSCVPTHHPVSPRNRQITTVTAALHGSCAEQFRAEFSARVVQLTPERMEVDLIGVDASIVNAIRRILLAEVPTMAIETVWIEQNTSMLQVARMCTALYTRVIKRNVYVQDEVLAHRLGLVPIRADARLFTMFAAEPAGDAGAKATPSADSDWDGSTDHNMLEFSLDAQYDELVAAGCGLDPTPKTQTQSSCRVPSSALQWVPHGNQVRPPAARCPAYQLTPRALALIVLRRNALPARRPSGRPWALCTTTSCCQCSGPASASVCGASAGRASAAITPSSNR